jgi:hypothetical protein
MAAPVYRIGDQIVRVCWDGWMFELPSATASNVEGRELAPSEMEKVRQAIADKTAMEI